MASADELKALVRTIPDFPKPGIQYRDITTLLLDRVGLAGAVDALVASVDGPVDLVAAIEARGFIIGGALAVRLDAGLLLIRKDGKLPGETIAEDYALEYGTDRLAMHVDACTPDARVLVAVNAVLELAQAKQIDLRTAAYALALEKLHTASSLRGVYP